MPAGNGLLSWQLLSTVIGWVLNFPRTCFVQVAEEFTRLKPRNPLARFIPALKKLAGRGDRFTGLDGFEDEVRKLKSDAGGCWLADRQMRCLMGGGAGNGGAAVVSCGACPPSWPRLPSP